MLNISVKTVGTHKQRILEKLNLKNTTDIVKYALRKNYFSRLSLFSSFKLSIQLPIKEIYNSHFETFKLSTSSALTNVFLLYQPFLALLHNINVSFLEPGISILYPIWLFCLLFCVCFC